MSFRNNELKLDLERLRLASDFAELSRMAPGPGLKAHCIAMADYWSEQAEGSEGTTCESAESPDAS